MELQYLACPELRYWEISFIDGAQVVTDLNETFDCFTYLANNASAHSEIQPGSSHFFPLLPGMQGEGSDLLAKVTNEAEADEVPGHYPQEVPIPEEELLADSTAEEQFQERIQDGTGALGYYLEEGAEEEEGGEEDPDVDPKSGNITPPPNAGAMGSHSETDPWPSINIEQRVISDS